MSAEQRLVLDTRVPQIAQAAVPVLSVPTGSEASANVTAARQPRARLSALAEGALRALPAILSAAARARVEQQRTEQARAALRPSATGTLGAVREFERNGTTVPFQNFNTGVQVAVPLYRPQASAAVDTARLQFEAADAATVETGRDLLAALANAYIFAAQLEEETTSLATERDGLIAQRNLNQRRMQGGAGTLVEVLETAARAELVQAQVRGSEGAEKFQLAEVARLSNAPVARVLRLREEAPALIVPPVPDAALALARRENHTLMRLRLAAESARANINAQRAGSSPIVDLVGSLARSRTEVNGVVAQSPAAQVGVQVAIPIFNGGLINARVREAQAGSERADADLQDAELTLLADVTKAYADLERATAQMRANNSALAISLTSLKATQKAFDAGVRGNIDLLNAQQQTYAGRREAMRARAAHLLAQVRILALTGLLNQDSIKKLEASLTE